MLARVHHRRYGARRIRLAQASGRPLFLAVVATALLVACVDSGNDDQGDAGAETSRGVTTTQPSTTAPDVLAVSSWASTDGGRPALMPDCPGVLGICLGAPLERVTQVLGLEASRYVGAEAGEVGRQWEAIPGLTVTIETDAVGAVESITASVDEAAAVRLGLPGGAVLGEATMGSIVNDRGPPQDNEDFAAENSWFYTNVWRDGPEGSVALKYTVVSDGQELTGAAVGARRLSSFTAEYP